MYFVQIYLQIPPCNYFHFLPHHIPNNLMSSLFLCYLYSLSLINAVHIHGSSVIHWGMTNSQCPCPKMRVIFYQHPSTANSAFPKVEPWGACPSDDYILTDLVLCRKAQQL